MAKKRKSSKHKSSGRRGSKRSRSSGGSGAVGGILLVGAVVGAGILLFKGLGGSGGSGAGGKGGGGGGGGAMTFTLPAGSPGYPGVLPVNPGDTISRFSLLQRLASIAATNLFPGQSTVNRFRAATQYATQYQNDPSKDPSKQADENWIAKDPDFLAIAKRFNLQA